MPVLTDIPYYLNPTVLMEQLRLKPATDLSDNFLTLVEQVQKSARPRAMYSGAYIQNRDRETITLTGGYAFTSRVLRLNLDLIPRVFPFVATCGSEMDQIRIAPEDLIRSYWLHQLKLYLLRSALAYLQTDIRQAYHLDKISTMNPGSAEASVWPLEQQRILFDYLGEVEAQIGVQLNQNYIMQPGVSASGFIFPSEITYYNCQMCRRDACPSRKAPFEAERWNAINHSG